MHLPSLDRAAPIAARLQKLALGVAMMAAVLVGAAVPAHAATPMAGTTITNRGSATYIPAGYTQQETVDSNTVSAVVAAVEALTLSQDQSVQRPAGGAVRLSHLLTNTGNVASGYALALTPNAAGCPAGSTAQLLGLRAVRDNNANGIIDPSDTPLALGKAGALKLKPGEVASLIVEGTLPNNVATGTSCFQVRATTDTTGIQVANTDVIKVGAAAALAVTKSAVYPGIVQPGVSEVSFTVNASNIGNQPARPAATAPGGSTVMVDGVPRPLVLLRDAVPAGTSYVAGSLKSAMLGSLRLFRLPGDAPMSFRTSGDDASAVEVALGLPVSLPANASTAMTFSVKVQPQFSGSLINTALADFGNGAATVEERSNSVVVATTPERIGLAKAAGQVLMGVTSKGVPDGTATVRFTLRARNMGLGTLYGISLTDLLEGGGSQFGTYTTAAMPGQGQYTIVADSARVSEIRGVGATATIAPDFTGQSDHRNVLAPGAMLPPDGDMVVQFDVRFNLTGRPGVLYNGAQAKAAVTPGGPVSVTDESVSGNDPDPDRDGDPANNTALTPVVTAAPALALVQTVAPARPTGMQGVYDLDYTLTVTNTGNGVAPNVRLFNNLDCTFQMDLPQGQVESWTLVGAPRTSNGALLPASTFTGRATCDRANLNNPDPLAGTPTAVALSLVDGSRNLAPGQVEVVRYTVRVTIKTASYGVPLDVSNKTWAAAFDNNSVNVAPIAIVVAAADSNTTVLLSDPQGVVYNAVTREPVAGATVVFSRLSCLATAATPIVPDEIYNADSPGLYTFNPDGSVSTVTPDSGLYQFFLKVPPTRDLCTYRLSVIPPAGSGLVAPSSLLPVQADTFTSCGSVVSGSLAPVGAEPTTYYSTVQVGLNTRTNQLCEVIHNHIPLDPGTPNGLLLKKEGNVKQAAIGDFVAYTLTVSNTTQITLKGVRISDRLPTGFAYVPGTAKLNGQAVADPQGGRGPDLGFNFATLDLNAGQAATVTYRVRIGVGAPTSGTAINTARAESGAVAATTLRSNEAAWRINMGGGVFSDEAYAFGKVFMDCDKDGVQGSEEIGIPGVRLFMEDGTGVVTDVEGKWSLYGLRPVTHALKLDVASLPAGARLALLDNRQSGVADSRFVDLRKGEWQKANFAVDNCENTAVVAEVRARRRALAANPAAEGEAGRIRNRLDPEGKPAAVADARALPASGQFGSDGSLKTALPPGSALITLPSNVPVAPAGAASAPLVAGAASAAKPASAGKAVVAPLEESLDGIDNQLAFLGLKDRDVQAGTSMNVRVKGPAGSTLRLSVNGEVIDERRVGKRATVADRDLAAWEYIGVTLRPGENALKLEALDGFGNARGQQSLQVIAPDRLARVELQMAETAPADGKTPVKATLRLTDEVGVPVTARTAVTLESVGTRWDVRDLDPQEPGVQVFVEGGVAEFSLIGPSQPGEAKVRASAGLIAREARLVYLPDLRPLTGVGVLEGVIRFNKGAGLALSAPRASDAFEAELRNLSRGSGSSSAAGRVAFYFKGAVKGEYLLTAAYDSDKATGERMFRDIRPDEFYPIYGDSSAKTFDAQSTQRLYVRVDKNRSYLLYGDFTTASSPEVRQLSQTNRSLTGVRHHVEDGRVRVDTYASHDSLKQVIDEFPANGTSGPYVLSGKGDLFANSEKVEIVVRDRTQPNVVLRTMAVTRFSGYAIEPLTKTLLFTAPVPSLDPDLNPQSIRVTYEIDGGGQSFWVAGVDAQVKVGENVQLGAVAAVDRNPDNARQLAAATGLARVGEKTVVSAEAVQTRSDLKGQGKAVRVEVRHDDGPLKAQVQIAKTGTQFDNPGSALAAGHTDANAKVEYAVSSDTRVRGDAIYSKDVINHTERRGASVSVQSKLNSNVTVEAGLRAGQGSVATGGTFDYGAVSTAGAAPAPAAATGTTDSVVTVRGRVSAKVPDVPEAQVFGEAEQALGDSQRRVVAVGGNYQLNAKTRIYGRYEFISSLYGPYTLYSPAQNNVGLVGIENAYMEGGRLYNEYRLRDTGDGRSIQSALGVRNTFKLDEAWRLTAGFERTGALATVNGTPGGASTALTGGFEYLGQGDLKERLRASGTLELRHAYDSDSVLNTLGAAYKLDMDWSVLARSTISNTRTKASGASHLLGRQQIGAAYRPVDQDVWNTLAMYEHKIDRTSDGTGLRGTRTHVLSGHLNVQPQAGLLINGRYAAKWSSLDADGIGSSTWAQMLHGRVTKDLTRDWDVGLQAGLMVGRGGAVQTVLGIETGYQLVPNLWMSVGYNWLGLRDPDLSGGDYTDRGAYVRLRFKFDESLFAPRPGGATSK